MVFKRITKYFQLINEKIYERRGLQWIVFEGHYWLELRINNYGPVNTLHTAPGQDRNRSADGYSALQTANKFTEQDEPELRSKEERKDTLE